MLRKIVILTVIIAHVVCSQAQQVKFGVHVDPFIGFMDSNEEKLVVGAAVNGGVEFGVDIEYRFGYSGTAAFTFGVDFAVNRGGSLLYKYGGELFGDIELNESELFDNLTGTVSLETAMLTGGATNTNVDLAAFTKVNYSINYIEIPLGLKLRTEELGGSYIRAFFHIPLVKIMVPVSASAKIFSPDTGADNYVKDNGTLNNIPYSVSESDESSKISNAWKAVTPLQIGVGLGAGVEFAPTDPDGLRLYAGVYYMTGVLDATDGFKGANTTLRKDNSATVSSKNPRNAQHNISIRIGVIF
ncbi:outer membrane beta-barrel protein [Aureispira]|nr:outer membrane beta-barrel protein [Aureispira sp.]